MLVIYNVFLKTYSCVKKVNNLFVKLKFELFKKRIYAIKNICSYVIFLMLFLILIIIIWYM